MTSSDWVLIIASIVGALYTLVQIGDRLWKNKVRKEDSQTHDADASAARSEAKDIAAAAVQAAAKLAEKGNHNGQCSDGVERALGALIENTNRLADQMTQLTMNTNNLLSATEAQARISTARFEELLRSNNRGNGK